jgi:hypothetical protein
VDGAQLFRRSAATFNKAVLPLLRSGPGRRLFGGSMAVLTYRGRRSGREVTLPVSYRRDKGSGEVVVHVMAPDAKTWWKNFTGDGAPLTLRIGSESSAGYARAARTAKGPVAVRITVEGA